MQRWLEKGFLKRSTAEPDSFAIDYDENDTNYITSKEIGPVAKKCRNIMKVTYIYLKVHEQSR